MANKLIHCPPHLSNLEYVCGIDEVGKGPAAGPVVAGAVILPSDFYSDLIKDSKLLSEKQLYKAYDIILENALAYSVQASSVKYINSNGINPATFNAMHKCIDNLSITPNVLLVDGIQWSDYNNIKYETVVKGDNTYLCIAAASIMAKVKRDEYMVKLSKEYPHYHFESNKGYLTKKHGEGILEHGISPYHREQYVNTWLKKQK